MKESLSRKGVISGIYNYCDRWCKYCEMSGKCALFIQEQMIREEFEKEEAPLEQVKVIMEVTGEMLEEAMQEIGIPSIPETLASESSLPGPKDNELTRQSMDYGLQVFKWLNEMEIPEDTGVVSAALEVVQFYSTLIGAKMYRAVIMDEPDEDSQYDSNGSAKVALLSIDKSLNAWMVLYEHLADRQDMILARMRELTCLRDQLEKKFPHARTFVRPGFDE